MSVSLAAEDASRTRARRWFVAFVVFQLVVPLTYYVRGDRYDERFAWRMFSAVRVESCRADASEIVAEGGRPYARDLDIGRETHVAWLELVERKKRDVTDAFLRRRCEAPDVTRVRVTTTCTNSRGEPLPPFVRSLECDAR